MEEKSRCGQGLKQQHISPPSKVLCDYELVPTLHLKLLRLILSCSLQIAVPDAHEVALSQKKSINAALKCQGFGGVIWRELI